MKPSDRPTYVLTFRPTYDGSDDAHVIRAIRWLAKVAGRNFRLQMTSMDVVREETPNQPRQGP